MTLATWGFHHFYISPLGLSFFLHSSNGFLFYDHSKTYIVLEHSLSAQLDCESLCMANCGFHFLLAFESCGLKELRSSPAFFWGPVFTMSSWHVDDLAKEIADMEVIYARSKGSELLPRMKDALKSKVEGIQALSPSSFVRLCDAVGKSSLPSEIKKELEDCLEAKAATSIQGPTRLQTMPQSMTMPFSYLSQSEWKQLEVAYNKVDFTNIIIKRIKACGLKSIKEDTKKGITTFLVCLQMKDGHPLPSKQEMYDLAGFVHDTFMACVAQPLHAGLARYPPSPYDIGEAQGSCLNISLCVMGGP